MLSLRPILLWIVGIATACLVLFAAIHFVQLAIIDSQFFNAPEVKLIVPSGFRGVIHLKEPSTAAEEASAISFTQTGRRSYSLAVPASGEAFVRGNDLFANWHSFAMEYVDGGVLTDGENGAADGDESMHYFGGGGLMYSDDAAPPGTPMKRATQFLVGTRSDYDWYLRDGPTCGGPIPTDPRIKVQFLLPDGFEGLFTVFEEYRTGMDVSPNVVGATTGDLIVKIPISADGRANVRDLDWLQWSVNREVVAASGLRLTGQSNEKEPAAEFELMALNCHGNQHLTYCLRRRGDDTNVRCPVCGESARDDH